MSPHANAPHPLVTDTSTIHASPFRLGTADRYVFLKSQIFNVSQISLILPSSPNYPHFCMPVHPLHIFTPQLYIFLFRLISSPLLYSSLLFLDSSYTPVHTPCPLSCLPFTPSIFPLFLKRPPSYFLFLPPFHSSHHILPMAFSILVFSCIFTSLFFPPLFSSEKRGVLSSNGVRLALGDDLSQSNIDSMLSIASEVSSYLNLSVNVLKN